jgi:hypothetical protein
LILFKILKSQMIFNIRAVCKVIWAQLCVCRSVPRRQGGNAPQRDLFGGKDEIQAAALGRT